jgi:hypothetical protein
MGGGGRGPQSVYAIAADGTLHTLGAMEGKDLKKPLAFLPPGANVSDTIAVGETIYAATTNGCGGVPNGIWALDRAAESPKVVSWKSGGNVAGIAFDSKGALFAAIGEGADGAGEYADSIVSLEPKTLELKDRFSAGALFATSPTIFSYDGQEFVAAAAKDGRIFLLSAASLGGTDHKTPLQVSAATTKGAPWTPAALATWEDASRNRFLLAPAVSGKGTIIAYKVSGTAASPRIEQAWATGDLGAPSAPIVVNGVVFALKTGSTSSPAVLYAFDGASGRELWNSGKTITSYVRSTALWSSNAQVYVATQDATVYAFGFAMDRHL